jgi:carbamoyl-phosphate synthase large subunit
MDVWMIMKSKRVFISGGAGVIGLEMVPRLISRGATVMVGDLKPRPPNFAADLIYRQGDLNHMTAQELAAFQPEVFIHLAATFERSTEHYDFWEENFWHNVRLSHHLMTIVKDLPSLRRVVFASSYLIYDPKLYQFGAPRDQAVSLKETDPVQPRNLTGMAKFAHEIELRFIDQFRSHRFSTVCARIFRGYGRNSRDVISRWIRSLIKGEGIMVYRPEGMFDYIYAADSAEGLVRLADTPSVTGVINLGTGRARRVQEVLDILLGHFPKMDTTPVDSNIAYEASQAQMRSFRQRIDWIPVYDLEHAIPEIISYERAKLRTKCEVPVPYKVLISSASKKIPLLKSMQKAARRIHPDSSVVAGDLSRNALSGHVADEFWAMPPTTENNLDEILQGCRERGIGVVLPTRDNELPFWARHADRFRSAGIAVIVSPPESVEICLDKLKFSDFGLRRGLPFIPSSLKTNLPDTKHFVVKERFGAGSRNIGLNLKRADAENHARLLEQPVYQTHVAGTEISVDAWLDRRHRVKGLVLRKREFVVNGESQITITFRDARLEAQAKQVLEALQLSGPIVLQAMVTPDSEFSVIECNARIGGASTLSIAAGLDSLYWSLLEAAGADIRSYPFHRAAGELRQVRVPSDIYFHVPHSDF